MRKGRGDARARQSRGPEQQDWHGTLGLAVCRVICGGVAVAQTKLTGGPSPSPAGAEVYFIDLKDGATVPANLKIISGCAIWASPPQDRIVRSGHHHLLIDTELPPLDRPFRTTSITFTSARPDRGGDYPQAGPAYIAVALGRQEPCSAYAAGHVGPHSG